MISCTHQTTKSPKADEVKFIYAVHSLNEHCAVHCHVYICVHNTDTLVNWRAFGEFFIWNVFHVWWNKRKRLFIYWKKKNDERTLWWIGALVEFYCSEINEWSVTCILMKYNDNCSMAKIQYGKETIHVTLFQWYIYRGRAIHDWWYGDERWTNRNEIIWVEWKGNGRSDLYIWYSKKFKSSAQFLIMSKRIVKSVYMFVPHWKR